MQEAVKNSDIDLDHYTDMTVGEILKKTREHFAQTINQVSVNLRIRSSYIEALEQGNLDILPGRVYAIGFVRAYAEYLGLDGDKIVYLFKVQSVGKKRRFDVNFKKPIFENQTPSLYMVLGSLAAAIFLLVYLSIYHVPEKFRESIPPVPESLKRSTLVSYQDVDENITTEDVIGEKIDHILGANEDLHLVIESDSWVEIRDENNNVLLSQVLKKGNTYPIPEDSKLTMITGNAGGVAVYDGEKRVKLLGKPAEVKRGIALDRANLLEN